MLITGTVKSKSEKEKAIDRLRDIRKVLEDESRFDTQEHEDLFNEAGRITDKFVDLSDIETDKMTNLEFMDEFIKRLEELEEF